MSYSKDGKDWLGNERVEHFDDKGNKVGTSKDGKDWLGNERVEHFDDKGNKVGISKDGKDWLGNERVEHFDDSGKKTGTSKSEKDIFGNDIIQHYDNQGNKTKYTKAEKNWLGQTIFKHRSGGGSSDGLYGIIAVVIIIVLIVVAVLGTFSYPYKLVDSNISPFQLDWTSNENVWIFCFSIWLLFISSIIFLKNLFTNRSTEFKLDEIIPNPLFITISIFSTLSVVIQYLIKSKFPENFLLISILLTLVIIGITFLISKNSKFKVYIIITTIILSTSSLIYINTKSDLVASAINTSNEIINTNNSTNSVDIDSNDDEKILNKEREYVKNQLKDFENASNLEKIEKYKILINRYSNEELDIPQSVRYYELGSLYGRCATLPFYEMYYDSLTNSFIDQESYEKYIDSAIYFNKKALELTKNQIYAFYNLCFVTRYDIWNSSENTNPQSYSANRNNIEFSERLNYIISNSDWVLKYDTKNSQDLKEIKQSIIETIFSQALLTIDAVSGDSKEEYRNNSIKIAKNCTKYLDNVTNFKIIRDYSEMKRQFGL
jgi:predicted membrane channel-forming protein YqfA (hemolysin III family)